MSNRTRHHHRPRRKPTEIENYAVMLHAAGFEDREVARAVAYAEHYGLAALSSTEDDDRCITFGEPTCANWNCIAPEHQVLNRECGHDHG